MTKWRFARLEEVAEIFGGGTPSRTEASYFGGGIAWATPTDITSLAELYISATKESITEAGLNNSSTKLLPVGAVLLTSRATIGFTAVSTIPICTNQGFVNLVCGPDLVPEYLAYWLRTQRDKMFQHAGGTTFKEIARGTLRKFEIAFPPLSEQRRIVDLLSRAEGIVRLRREAKRKAAELVPALFLDMFGDPASNPKGWQLYRVDELLERFEGGKNLQAGDDESATYRILKISAVTSGSYIESESKPAPSDLIPARSHFVRTGDLLISRANTEALVGATAIVDRTDGRTLLPDKLWRFVWRSDTAIEPRFALHLFQQPAIRNKLSQLASGTGGSMKNISQAKLKTLELPVPPIELQRQFAVKVEAVCGIAAQQGAALAAAQATFDALLHQSFRH